MDLASRLRRHLHQPALGLGAELRCRVVSRLVVISVITLYLGGLFLANFSSFFLFGLASCSLGFNSYLSCGNLVYLLFNFRGCNAERGALLLKLGLDLIDLGHDAVVAICALLLRLLEEANPLLELGLKPLNLLSLALKLLHRQFQVFLNVNDLLAKGVDQCLHQTFLICLLHLNHLDAVLNLHGQLAQFV